ncbi:hypothetical protein COY27_07245, partial [Candidatus Woesearchaeota archaeon CG_4_10_14_0_2_um_filter_33_13]
MIKKNKSESKKKEWVISVLSVVLALALIFGFTITNKESSPNFFMFNSDYFSSNVLTGAAIGLQEENVTLVIVEENNTLPLEEQLPDLESSTELIISSDDLSIQATEISACGATLNTANEVYTLTTDISTAATCLTVAADNITIDCAGYTILGIGSGEQGVNTQEYDNLTIYNCNFSSLDYGVYLYRDSDSVNIFDNQFSGNSRAIFIDQYGSSDPNNFNISNNNFTGQTESDMYIEYDGSSGIIYGNIFAMGILESGTDTGDLVSLCSHYGNYYPNTILAAKVPSTDCGPSPSQNSTVNGSLSADEFTWGGSHSYKDLRSALFNTNSSKTILFVENLSASAYEGNIFAETVRNNIEIDCQDYVYSDPTANSVKYGLYFTGEFGYDIHNCVFN